MITGFNTDVKHKSKVYHVQTEDKGRKNPKIETLVYMGGEILDSFRTVYDDQDREQLSEDAIIEMMEHQHKKVIKSIKIGQYDSDHDDEVDFLTERALDEVILDYLSDQPSNPVTLQIDEIANVKRGKPCSFTVQASVESGDPIASAAVRVKLVSSSQKPKVLSSGETNANGKFTAEFDLPPIHGDDFTVLIQVTSDQGTAEFRHQI